MPRSRPLLERFSEKYRIDEQTGCWIWTGAIMTGGYGMICAGKGMGNIGAHRASYMLRHGDLAHRVQVLHRCDNPNCVNPDHLFIGSHQANMKDMEVKGRAKGLERSDQIDKMLTLLEVGISQTMVANLFGVHRTTIQRTLDRLDIARQRPPDGYIRPPGGHRYLTVEQRNEILRLLSEDVPVAHIARQFKVDRKTVRNVRKVA